MRGCGRARCLISLESTVSGATVVQGALQVEHGQRRRRDGLRGHGRCGGRLHPAEVLGQPDLVVRRGRAPGVIPTDPNAAVQRRCPAGRSGVQAGSRARAPRCGLPVVVPTISAAYLRWVAGGREAIPERVFGGHLVAEQVVAGHRRRRARTRPWRGLGWTAGTARRGRARWALMVASSRATTWAGGEHRGGGPLRGHAIAADERDDHEGGDDDAPRGCEESNQSGGHRDRLSWESPDACVPPRPPRFKNLPEYGTSY